MSMLSNCKSLLFLSAISIPLVVSWKPVARVAGGPLSRRDHDEFYRSTGALAFSGAVPVARTSQYWRRVTTSVSRDARWGRGGLRMQGRDEDALAAEMVLVRAMRASQIKQSLTEMSIGTAGVFEVGVVSNMILLILL